MALPIKVSISRQPKIQHYSTQSNKIPKHKQKLVSKHQNNSTAAPQLILPNIPIIIVHILQSDPLLSNKTHPAPVNQWWVVINISRSHRRKNYKVSPKVINLCQWSYRPKKQWPVAADAENVTPIETKAGEKKWSNLPDISANWKYIFWPYW